MNREMSYFVVEKTPQNELLVTFTKAYGLFAAFAKARRLYPNAYAVIPNRKGWENKLTEQHLTKYRLENNKINGAL